MTDIYDLPNATHFEQGVTGIISYANTVSEGIFTPLFLLALWIIVFLGSVTGIKMNASSGWIFASFLCGVIAVPMAIAGMLNSKFIYVLVILLAIGVFWSVLENAE